MLFTMPANTHTSMGCIPIQIAALRVCASYFVLVVVYNEAVLVVCHDRASDIMISHFASDRGLVLAGGAANKAASVGPWSRGRSR